MDTYIDPTAVRLLPEVLWVAVAPALVLLAPRRRELAWLAPPAAAWAAWRCLVPAVLLPFELGGFAGYLLGPCAILAALLLVGSSIRAAIQSPEIGVKVRHAVVLSAFALGVVAIGAVAAAFRLSAVRGG